MTDQNEDDVSMYFENGNNAPYIESAAETVKATTKKSVKPTIPDYLQKTYYWCYLNPCSVKWLDSEPVVKSILWWQHNKLCRQAFSEIKPGDSVLQVAAVYGHFSKQLAEHIGANGKLKVIDVAPIQVMQTKEKLSDYPQAEVMLADAAMFEDETYDVVLCYFLLHEIPDDYKTKVIENMLRHLKPKGKLVIVDYHKPHWFHPIKPITSLVFDTLEPFAKTLWRKSIFELTNKADKFKWRHNKIFGGLYQKVVIEHNHFNDTVSGDAVHLDLRHLGEELINERLPMVRIH